MIDISTLPNVDPATAELAYGEMVDVTTPGDGTGTPVRLDWQSDMIYFLYAILEEAGITANGVAEGVLTSQGKDAVLRIARKQVGAQSYSNLLVKRNVGTPNSKVDVTFDKMWIEGIEKLSGSYTIDITASGALGLDTGAEANDAWYYIWMIAKTDGTVSALLSASATSPTLPAGYAYKRLVSAVRNKSGNFVDFYQYQNNYVYPELGGKSIITVAATDGGTARDISTYVPALKVKAKLNLTSITAPLASVTDSKYYVQGHANGVYAETVSVIAYNNGLAATFAASGSGMVITDNQNIKTTITVVSANTVSLTVYLTSFELDI